MKSAAAFVNSPAVRPRETRGRSSVGSRPVAAIWPPWCDRQQGQVDAVRRRLDEQIGIMRQQHRPACRRTRAQGGGDVVGGAVQVSSTPATVEPARRAQP